MRRDLRFKYEGGVDCLSNEVIFEQLTLIGDLRFKDEGGVDCLSNEVIFEQLTLIGSTMASAIICLAINQKFNFSKYIFENMVKHLDGRVKFFMYPSFVQVFLDNHVEGMDRHNAIFIISSHTKKVFVNMKREGKGFSRVVTPLFETIMVQAPKDMGEGSEIPTDPHHTPIVIQPSSTQPQRKQKTRRKQMKETEAPSPSSEIPNEEGVPRTSSDPLPSATRVESSTEEASLGDQEDASKQGRKIDDIDQDVEITLVDKTQGRMNEEDMFGVNGLDGDEVIMDATTGKNVEQSAKVAKKDGVEVSTAEVITAGTTSQIYKDELTLAQTLIEIKAAKPKVITTAATRPKEKGIVMQEPSETPSPKLIDSSQKPSQDKEKGNGKMMLFNNTIKRIEAFVPIDTELVKGSKKEVKGSEKTKEGSSKRARSNLQQEDAKRQRLEEENESAELKRCLEIIPEDDDDVTIEATPLSSKSQTIIDYKIYKEGRKIYFKIIRADSNSQNCLTFGKMFKNFNIEDCWD
nr:hypothetical protein [Tanacetum cinerariifolium]